MENTPKMTTVPRKAFAFPLALLIVLVAHGVILLGSELVRGRDRTMTPEEMIERARTLERQEEYDESLALYTQAMRQKPEIPPIWHEAERELQQVRLKAEQKRRRLASERQAESEGPPEAPEADTEEGATEPPPETIDLPQLPDIGGF